jgi:peptidoglycan hydrolase-like protein with peptidoglycan-binding domain
MYPNTNLQPGQTGAEVKKLQDFLVSKGLMTAQQVATGPGIYGPQTTAAVKKFQQQAGVDNTSGPGYWGPKTISAASGAGNANSQPYTDEEYNNALNEHPIIKASVAKGNNAEDLAYAAETGDFSGLVNQFGQPFSLEDQQKALKQAEEDNALYFDALKQKETTDAENSLAQKQADYQNYLLQSGQNFEADKATADQSAANKGVLFSGGRVQKEKNLKKGYEQDQAYKQASLGRDISNTAQNFQYKYGNNAANGLSQYYKLGQNTFNPNVATGGVGSGSLSNVYNPNQYDYQGTQNVARKTEAQKRAAGYLWNKGNKLLATGYNNQY